MLLVLAALLTSSLALTTTPALSSDPPSSSTATTPSSSSSTEPTATTEEAPPSSTDSYTLLPAGTTTKDPADQAIEDILSLNTTTFEEDYYDAEAANSTTATIFNLPQQLVEMNVTTLEKYRDSLERMLARVEEHLARAAQLTTATPHYNASATTFVPSSSSTSETDPPPLPFRDFVTFPSPTPSTTTTTTQASVIDVPTSTDAPTTSTATEATVEALEEKDFTTDSVFANDTTSTMFTEPPSTSTSSTSGTTTEKEDEDIIYLNFASSSKEKKESAKRRRERCWKHSRDELVEKLKEEGTYNPDYMAWDVPGVIRFLDTAASAAYDHIPAAELDDRPAAAVERNLGALERILRELGLSDHCDLRQPDTIARLYNITYGEETSNPEPPAKDRLRTKRSSMPGHGASSDWLRWLYEKPGNHSSFGGARMRDAPMTKGVIGEVHTVPFGCSQRGSEEEGFLRLCGVCQAIRRLPDTFFPPFINEALCDEDKACLYFYDYPHGKCKQKQMNFVVLRNIGTEHCEIWRRFNLNVRVSCECFVDRMSFFAKYV